jgi:hypothetical protein
LIQGLITAQPSFGGGQDENHRLGRMDLTQKEVTLSSPRHTQLGSSQTRNTNGDNGLNAMEMERGMPNKENGVR